MIVVEGCSTRVENARPCPFCGGHNIFSSSREHFAELLVTYQTSPMIEIGCRDCGCCFNDFEDGNDYDERLAEVIRRWNDRPVWDKCDGGYKK